MSNEAQKGCWGKNVQPIEKVFLKKRLRQNFESMPGGKISVDWENAPKNGSFAACPIHQNQRKRCKEDYMKSITGMVDQGGREKQSREISRIG